MRYYKSLLVLILFGTGVFVLQNGCGGASYREDAGEVISQIQANEYFSPTSPITSLNYQVEFEEGAKPYVGYRKSSAVHTGTAFVGIQWWRIFGLNMEKLFEKRIQQHNFKLYTPDDQYINSKTAFPGNSGLSKKGQSRSTNEIIDLGRQLKNSDTSTGRAVIILFLNGYYEGNRNILGVSFGGTSIIALFKEVIENGLFDEKEQVEQAVLVHEAGHALGLVNNGVPMKALHEDTIYDPAKKAHCSNDQCVMFWSVNTVSNIPDRIKKRVMFTPEILFGQECFDDVHNYTP